MVFIPLCWPLGLQAGQDTPDYAEAKMNGAGTFSIIRNHIMPNIAGPVLVTAALHSSAIIMELSGLSFLGLGVMPPAAEWGAMLNDGRGMLQQAPWLILAPSAAIFLVAVIMNNLADTMRDYFDKRSRQR